jgi:hypothetical protein
MNYKIKVFEGKQLILFQRIDTDVCGMFPQYCQLLIKIILFDGKKANAFCRPHQITVTKNLENIFLLLKTSVRNAYGTIS